MPSFFKKSGVHMFDNFQQATVFFANRKMFGIKPGLDRMHRLLQLLDCPQHKLKAVHVAGTNGKGSTIHYLKAALQANGNRVGVFTSPSPIGLTGHILFDDQPISETAFVHLLNEMYPVIQKLDSMNNHPTEFEIITAMAFVYFADQVDIALIETGMGGREDTTNCFTPIISIITNVTRDHMAFLGNTVKEIAFHKAGIIKQDRPVVIGDMNPEAFAVIEQEAYRNNARIYQFAQDFTTTSMGQVENNQHFMWSCSGKKMTVSLKMRGKHQEINASVAIMALSLLKMHGYPVSWDKAIAAIGRSQLAGRFELISDNPSVIIDGAHNVAGIQSFIRTVLRHYPDRERHLIFAGFKDKELTMMLNLLCDHFASITITTFDHPRAINAESLYRAVSCRNKLLEPDWHHAVKQICNETARRDKVFFITGSLHFILQVRKYFRGK
ncbi:bifunctional folylpolyglutamate synthase/dihydrofolate synthase [Lentibacillus populi]|nr:folylpolyglutamate synthase/dihydrofolate synthase family protein [Lentibacillus populi]